MALNQPVIIAFFLGPVRLANQQLVGVQRIVEFVDEIRRTRFSAFLLVKNLAVSSTAVRMAASS